jgi:hypothetical protein
MQPLEEVDGVSEAVVAQGQVIPSDAIAAGDAPTLLLVTCTEFAPQSTMAGGHGIDPAHCMDMSIEHGSCTSGSLLERK